MKRLWPFLLCVCLPLQAADLPADMAVYVAPVESGPPLLMQRADEAVNPASTMKLLTSFVALDRLRPGFTWKTTLVSDAPVKAGVLEGDLWWVGEGDPRLTAANLQTLLQSLRARGIRAIRGRLVLDGHAFTRLSTADGFVADEGRTFMTPPTAHLAQFNVGWLQFFADDAGARAVLDPPLAGVTVDAQLQADTGGCEDVRKRVGAQLDGRVLRIRGAVAPACDGARMFLPLLPADEMSVALWQAQWAQLGGAGPAGSARGVAPAGARVLASLESEPLWRILPDMNKYSNNAMARAVYMTLGRVRGEGDTLDNAEAAVRETLASHHLPVAPLVLENGSGLSRRERVSVRLMGEMLREALRGPYAGEFLASLPAASEEGTLRRRLKDVGPRLRLKTGTLEDARALAGVWQGPDGQRLVIVVMLNGSRVANRVQEMDDVVRGLIGRFGHGV